MKKVINTLGKISSGVATTFTLSIGKVYAASADDYLGGMDFGVGSPDLMSWIKQILNLVIGISGLVSVAILIAAGYMFITAAGNEDTIAKATKTLTFAIIGLVICLISVLIVQFVLNKVIAV